MTQTPEALTTEQFKQAIIDKGQYYHIYHPFHVMMYEGKATNNKFRLGLQTATTIKSIFRSKMPRSWQIVLINVCDRNGFSA